MELKRNISIPREYWTLATRELSHSGTSGTHLQEQNAPDTGGLSMPAAGR